MGPKTQRVIYSDNTSRNFKTAANRITKLRSAIELRTFQYDLSLDPNNLLISYS